MSAALQQLVSRGQVLLAESEEAIEDETRDALLAWLAELQQLLHDSAHEQTRADLEQILAVNEAITERVLQYREELGDSIRQTRTGINAVKAYQGKA
jgi:flagellar motility protein MotE (MotC chaperone)